MIDTDTIPLDALLDQLIEITPPSDDPTGAETCSQLRRRILLRNLADHQITSFTATLDSLGVAEKAGSTTMELLIEMGLRPAAATRTARIADSLGTLGKMEACAADGRLSGEIVDALETLLDQAAVGAAMDRQHRHAANPDLAHHPRRRRQPRIPALDRTNHPSHHETVVMRRNPDRDHHRRRNRAPADGPRETPVPAAPV